LAIEVATEQNRRQSAIPTLAAAEHVAPFVDPDREASLFAEGAKMRSRRQIRLGKRKPMHAAAFGCAEARHFGQAVP